MKHSEVLAAVPLALGVGAVLLCALGLLRARDAFDRLHLAGAAALAGPIAIALALVLAAGPGSTTSRAVLIALAFATTGPVLSHAIARATRLRQCGDLEVRGDEETGAP